MIKKPRRAKKPTTKRPSLLTRIKLAELQIAAGKGIDWRKVRKDV